MPRKKNNFELTTDLNKQFYLLKKSCDDFDAGDEVEALNIATSLSLLLHDTKNTSALYFQLGYHKYPFLSKTSRYLPESLTSYSGLVGIHTTVGKPSEYSAQIDNSTSEITIMFDDWLNEVVIDDRKKLYSRKDIILYLANKVDGTHVDANLIESFDDLPVLNTISWYTSSGEEQIEFNTILYPTVRVIAQEVLDSFDVYHKHIHNTTTQQNKYAFNWTFKVYNVKNKRLFISMANDDLEADYFDTIFSKVDRFEGGYFSNREYYEVFITQGNRVTGSYYLLNK